MSIKRVVFVVMQGENILAFCSNLTDARLIAKRWTPKGKTNIVRTHLVAKEKRTRKPKAIAA